MLPLLGPLLAEIVGSGGAEAGLASALRAGSAGAKGGQGMFSSIAKLLSNPDAAAARKDNLPLGQVIKNNPGSFGEILSGKRSGDDVQQDDKRSRVLEDGTSALKTFSKSLTLTVGSIAALPFAAKKFADSVLSMNEPLARFNGQIANAYAKLEYSNVLRTAGHAQATSGTSSALVNAVNEFSDKVQPAKDAMVNSLNIIATAATKTLTYAATGVQVLGAIATSLPILKETVIGIKALMALLLPNTDPDSPWVAALNMKARERKTPSLPNQPNKRGP